MSIFRRHYHRLIFLWARTQNQRSRLVWSFRWVLPLVLAKISESITHPMRGRREYVCKILQGFLPSVSLQSLHILPVVRSPRVQSNSARSSDCIIQTPHHLITVRYLQHWSNGSYSSTLYFSIFFPKRVVIVTQELRHPIPAIAALGGGYPSPIFSIKFAPPTALNAIRRWTPPTNRPLQAPRPSKAIKSLQEIF